MSEEFKNLPGIVCSAIKYMLSEAWCVAMCSTDKNAPAVEEMFTK